MLSKIPINIEKVRGKELEKEILRVGIIAELDAINLYEQMAELLEDGPIKNVLLDIAKEEKVHVGEFQSLLLRMDEEQKESLEEGDKEVEEIMEKAL